MRNQPILLSIITALSAAACVVEAPPETGTSKAALTGTAYFACDDRGCEPTRRPDPTAPFVVACGARSCEITRDTGATAVIEHDVARGVALAMIADWREARQVDATYPWGGGPHPYFFEPNCVLQTQLEMDIPIGGGCPDLGTTFPDPVCGTGGPCPPEPDCDISPVKCATCTIEFMIRLSACAAGGPAGFPFCAVKAGLDYEECVEKKCEC